MNKKTLLIGAGLIAVLLIGYFALCGEESNTDVTAKVEQGSLEVTVKTTGELKAKNSEKIMGPAGMRKAGIWSANITDMVAEGTVVDSGDYIATLDRTEVTDKVKTLYSDLEKAESQYLAQKLDTSLTLHQARDELVNLRYAMEEKKLGLFFKLSIFWPSTRP